MRSALLLSLAANLVLALVCTYQRWRITDSARLVEKYTSFARSMGLRTPSAAVTKAGIESAVREFLADHAPAFQVIDVDLQFVEPGRSRLHVILRRVGDA